MLGDVAGFIMLGDVDLPLFGLFISSQANIGFSHFFISSSTFVKTTTPTRFLICGFKVSSIIAMFV